MISVGGWIDILIILYVFAAVTSKEDECYKRSVSQCRRCKKDCKWHKIVMKFDEMNEEDE